MRANRCPAKRADMVCPRHGFLHELFPGNYKEADLGSTPCGNGSTALGALRRQVPLHLRQAEGRVVSSYAHVALLRDVETTRNAVAVDAAKEEIDVIDVHRDSDALACGPVD